MKNDTQVMRTAVVTGGNRGIGLDIVTAFVRAGYFVVVGARTENKSLDMLGNKVKFESVDVRKESAHINLVNSALRHSGRLDVYINNAGVSDWRCLEDIDEEFLDGILETNLKGSFWGCKAAASALKEGGSIINISSIAGKRGSANNSAYVASKFGVNGLTQSLAKELGGRQIRVNALCPVLISTDGLLKALENVNSPAKGDPVNFLKKFTEDNSALKRLPSGSEVANMCLVLASESASAVTGQCINVDCGVFPQ
jgi:NAD(P)-dependent dehydrogenase (short-subunit alcohol dehydrogenase family)